VLAPGKLRDPTPSHASARPAIRDIYLIAVEPLIDKQVNYSVNRSVSSIIDLFHRIRLRAFNFAGE
jgi:hypothetical protein